MKALLLATGLVAGGTILVTQPQKTEQTENVLYKLSSQRRTFVSVPVRPVSIVIDKSDYELHVYDAKGWYATYPVVFGNSSLADKKMEGDRNTPEGSFRIVNKRVHDKWDRYMGLDYPTAESMARFKQRQSRGEVPRNASPGGGIGIHGVFPHEDFVVDRFKNWTNGCISMKNSDVEELYSFIPINTPVTIRR